MKSILVKKYQKIPLRRRRVQKIRALKSEKDPKTTSPNRIVFFTPCIKNLIEPRISYSHLRSDSSFYTLQTFVPNTQYGKSSFSYMAPVEWNRLPQDIRLCPTIECFKQQLKSYYFIQCFDNS